MPDPFRLPRGALELARLQRQQWLPPEELRALQWRRLVEMVRWAEASSPLYRRRFREAGVSSRDLRGWDDLARFPVTTREDLQDAEAMIADGVDRRRLRRSVTSGSTGTPTTTWFDDEGWFLGRYLLKLRARLACGLRPWHRVAVIHEQPPGPARVGLAGRRASFSLHQDPAEILPRLRAYRPTALYGPPSYLGRLADRAGGIPGLRMVFTSAELPDPATRSRIEAGTGASVLDVYGCTETKEVAWECRAREGYHVNAEWLVMEVADGTGPGDLPSGTILLTSLYNRAMPLLRYRVGDVGRAVEGRCPCGRGLPLVLPVLGRQVDHLRLPGGRTVSPYTLTCAVEVVEGLRQYQIVQETRDTITVRVVPGEGFGEATAPAIRAALRPALYGLDVRVDVVPSIPREPSGKFRIVRCDLRDGPP